MALDEDGFLPAAFRKVKKIGKGLKSNGTSNIAGFLLRNRSSHKAWERRERIVLVGAFLCLHFTRATRYTFTGWFSFLIFRHSIRFSSLRYTL